MDLIHAELASPLLRPHGPAPTNIAPSVVDLPFPPPSPKEGSSDGLGAGCGPEEDDPLDPTRTFSFIYLTRYSTTHHSPSSFLVNPAVSDAKDATPAEEPPTHDGQALSSQKAVSSQKPESSDGEDQSPRHLTRHSGGKLAQLLYTRCSV